MKITIAGDTVTFTKRDFIIAAIMVVVILGSLFAYTTYATHDTEQRTNTESN